MDKQIMCEILDSVRQSLGEGYSVLPVGVVNNNDTELMAFRIGRTRENFAVQLYVDQYIDLVKEGSWTLERATQKIITLYQNDEGKCCLQEGFSDAITKEYILENVVHCVINAEKNVKYLSDKVFWQFLDLAVIYRVTVHGTDSIIYSVVLTNDICNGCGICLDELKVVAEKNMKKQGFCTRLLGDVLTELTGDEYFIKQGEEIGLWVCTTNSGINGAAVLLHNEIFADLAEKVGRDLYIFPSSIHEVLVIPAQSYPEQAEVEALHNMVTEINTTQVPRDEVLSNNVYYYNHLGETVSILHYLGEDTPDDSYKVIHEGIFPDFTPI